MPILSPEGQAAARDMDAFSIVSTLMRDVMRLEDSLSTFELATPKLLEPRSLNVRDAIREIAMAAEQIELAIWVDATRSWALADSIRMRTALLWEEWENAKGERCLWLAQARAGPTRRQLRAIRLLCETLKLEMILGQQPAHSKSA